MLVHQQELAASSPSGNRSFAFRRFFETYLAYFRLRMQPEHFSVSRVSLGEVLLILFLEVGKYLAQIRWVSLGTSSIIYEPG